MNAPKTGLHLEHDHIAAVYPDRATAEAAVEALREHGFGSEHLGVAVHDPHPIDFEHDAESEMTHDAVAGVAAGTPLGALAGLAIGALVSTGFGAIGIGGIFALGAATGIWGGLLGGYLGTAAGDVAWDEHQDFGFVALEPGEVLIVVCGHGQPATVESVMQEAGGRLLPKVTAAD